MNDSQSLSHTKWSCKYHIVFDPKYRRKNLESGINVDGRSQRRPVTTGSQALVVKINTPG